jgi:hypothetical protein
MTVDVHSHCYFHEALNLMGDAAARIRPPAKGAPEHFIVIEQRLKEMDAMAIDMEILSINPFWYGKDRDTAAQIVKVQNEKLAELTAARPERFGAFASLTLQFPDLAAQQLETTIKKQGLRDAAIGASRPDPAKPKLFFVAPGAQQEGPAPSAVGASLRLNVRKVSIAPGHPPRSQEPRDQSDGQERAEKNDRGYQCPHRRPHRVRAGWSAGRYADLRGTQSRRKVGQPRG